MAKPPGFNGRIGIAFTADKNGRPIAYRWCFPAMRWIRIGYDAAKLHIAAGEADEIRYVR